LRIEAGPEAAQRMEGREGAYIGGRTEYRTCGEQRAEQWKQNLFFIVYRTENPRIVERKSAKRSG
jgi:hypothetical protein